SLQRHFTFPRLRERGRVVDLESIEQRVGVEKTQSLDDVKIAVPSEVAARVAVESAGVVEVRRVDDQRLARPSTDRVARPSPHRRRQMRTPVERNDSGVVHHLRVYDDRVTRLEDLVIAV